MSNGYHESDLPAEARDIHRALASLKEELEAVDWYNQRAEVASDPELKSIVLHNRDEEIEHAAMTLEWLRRKIPAFDEQLRTYLFTKGPVTEIEEHGAQGEAAPESRSDLGLGSLS